MHHMSKVDINWNFLYILSTYECYVNHIKCNYVGSSINLNLFPMHLNNIKVFKNDSAVQ